MIQIQYGTINYPPQTDLILIPLFEEDRKENHYPMLSPALQKEIDKCLGYENFNGHQHGLMEIKIGSLQIWLIGLGSCTSSSSLRLREIGGGLWKKLRGSLKKNAAIFCSDPCCEVVLGLLLRSWSLSYKTTPPLQKMVLTWFGLEEKRMEKIFEPYQHLYEGIRLARQLTAEPANFMYPEIFARQCQKLSSYGLQVEVLDAEALEKLGAKALLSVGKGSDRPPYLVSLQWRGNGNPFPNNSIGGQRGLLRHGRH